MASIKAARLFELGPADVVAFPVTDSMLLYTSRLEEERGLAARYDRADASRHLGRYLEAITTDAMRELALRDRRALHNLKYFTWVEQQGRTADELRLLWDPDFWAGTYAQVDAWDRAIEAFNGR